MEHLWGGNKRIRHGLVRLEFYCTSIEKVAFYSGIRKLVRHIRQSKFEVSNPF